MARDFDPISKISMIHGLLRREVEELVRMFDPASSRSMMETSYPLMDAVVRGGNIIVYVELPGVGMEDFTVYQIEDHLVVEGVKTPERIAGKVNFLRMERDFSPFRRILHLPFPVDSEKTRAVLKEGLLEIVMVPESDGVISKPKSKE